MSAAQTIMTTEGIEETLMLWSWGRWARDSIKREMGASQPGWVRFIIEGYRQDDKKEFLPEIDDEYGVMLDSVIAELSDRQKKIIKLYYSVRIPLTKLPKFLNTTTHGIRQERDIALGTLYAKVNSRAVKER